MKKIRTMVFLTAVAIMGAGLAHALSEPVFVNTLVNCIH